MDKEQQEQIERIVKGIKQLRPCFMQIQRYYTQVCDGRCEYPHICVGIVMEHIYHIKERRD